MSRIFVVGDHKTGTGPANVTKEYIRCLPKGTLFQKHTSKLMRLPELYINILRSDIIFFSGYSAQNVLGMRFAKRLNKPTAYLVHGAIDHENSINHYENAHMSEVEAKTLELADGLFAVSKKFCGWMKEQYPQYVNKIDYVTNGIDERSVNPSPNGDNTKILSIGGGMPRKMILHVCAAIEKINADAAEPLTLYVIGKDGIDTDAISQYPFVKNLGLVSAEKKEELFKECGIFIQNSCFETFGLAPVEALCAGMSVLCSKVCGVLDLFESADEHDIIDDYSSASEIAEKIEYVMEHSNREKLLSDIDFETMSWEARTKQLIGKLDELKDRYHGKA